MSNTARGCQAGPFPQSPPLAAARPPPPESPQAAQISPKHPLGHTAGTRGRGGSAAAFRCHHMARHSPAPPLHPRHPPWGRAPHSPRCAAAAGREHPAPALPWLRSLLLLPDSPALFRPVQKSKPPRLCVPQALTHPPCRLRPSVCPGGVPAKPGPGMEPAARTEVLEVSDPLWHSAPHRGRGSGNAPNPKAVPSRGSWPHLGLSPLPPPLQGEASPAWQELRGPNPLVQAGLH